MTSKSITQLAENLALIMETRELSQQALFRRSGVAQAKIGSILSGTQSTGINVIDRLAESLDLEPWQLIAPTDIMLQGMNKGLGELISLYERFEPKQRESLIHLASGLAPKPE